MGREQIKWAQVIFLRISTNQAPPKNIWSVLVFRFKSMFCGQKKMCTGTRFKKTKPEIHGTN